MATWQWSYNGLSFGEGTAIDVLDAAGLDFPDVRSSDQPRALTDGMWAGRDLAGGRTITLTLELVATDDATLASTLAAVRAALNLQPATELPLVFQLPGDTAKRIYCRPRRRAIPINLPYLYRVPQIVVQFAASDPLLYADAASSGSTGIAVAGSGLTFNATPNFSFGGAAAGGQLLVANSGDAPAPWTATVNGPIDDPHITLAASGESLTMIGSIADGDTLVIDSKTRSILLNGVASRYSWLRTGSRWFSLPPGLSEIDFGATAGTGSLVVAWRSASY